MVGIGKTSWNHYVNGERRISIDQAIKVCEKTGATTDFIYRGIGAGMSGQLLLDLQRGALPPKRS